MPNLDLTDDEHAALVREARARYRPLSDVAATLSTPGDPREAGAAATPRAPLTKVYAPRKPTSTVPILLCTLSTAPNPVRQVSTIAATSSARDAFPTTARRRHPHLNNLLGLGAASRLMSA